MHFKVLLLPPRHQKTMRLSTYIHLFFYISEINIILFYMKSILEVLNFN